MTKQIKVTDRRMFTPDGRLREEYRDVETTPVAAASARSASARSALATSALATSASATSPPAAAPPTDSLPPEEEVAPPAMTTGDGNPGREAVADAEPRAGFMDLLGLLAEHASVYLRQGSSGAGMEAGQSLEMAKLHIDLLAVVKEISAGNLDTEESAALDEILYQLKMGFVQVGG